MSLKEYTINWTLLAYDRWKLYVAKTDKGLCYVGSPGQSYESFEHWIEKHFPHATLVENEKALRPLTDTFLQFFEGKQQILSLPVDIKGTQFQEEVWKALNEIPYGQTCSYSDIAKMIKKPKAVRAVGSAIGANPVLITIPCHRVIGKNGAITGYRGGIELKQYLLDLEAKKRDEEGCYQA